MDTQTILLEMQKQLHENHNLLVEKVDKGFNDLTSSVNAQELSTQKQFAAIDNRLVIVENTRRTRRWLGATVLVAVLGGLVDFLFVHLPKFFEGASR